MQRWFIGACKEFFRRFLEIKKLRIVSKLQYMNIEGLQLDFKGRAENMRRVFVKRKKFGHTYNTGYGYYDVSKSYSLDFFTTK